MKRLEELNKPFKIYAEVLEDSALEQFVDVMSQDYVVKGALMADSHMGYTMPIGGVVACDNFVSPVYVGYDIGCGMCAYNTGIDKSALTEDMKDKIFKQIYRDIPVGMNRHKEEQVLEGLNGLILSDKATGLFKSVEAIKQLGTLGSGNHFLEIGYDSNDLLWIVIHSGSRGFGWQVADYYMGEASTETRVTKKGKTVKVKEGNFGFFADSNTGQEYINDLNYALKFALENRKHMITSVCNILHNIIGDDIPQMDYDTEGIFINRNHNHAEFDGTHWIHRKGATHAEDGMWGVIPANMRDGSFIVKGKGNPDSLSSSSHGAGRMFSRKKAKESLTVENFEKQMVGIVAKVEFSTLDESPDAYKNIFKVMELQKDLVEVVHHIKPLINIKA